MKRMRTAPMPNRTSALVVAVSGEVGNEPAHETPCSLVVLLLTGWASACRHRLAAAINLFDPDKTWEKADMTPPS